MSSVYLYAELLSNIRQVTLYASLQTDRNKETKIELSSDRKTISLSHDGEIATAFLPSEIAGTARLTIPIDAAKELSFRLQVAEATAEAPDSAFNDYDAPWPASDLTPAAQMRCRACQTKILKSTIDRAWKNLPSENWAEMMDFWHCHKPDDIETKDQQTKEGLARTKGYGSSSRVEAQPGVGLVDGSSFLLADQDCPGAQCTSLNSHNGHLEVECANCRSLLGFDDEKANGWRLYKSCLSMRPSDTSPWETYSVETYVCAQLLSLIDTQAVRKYVVHSGSSFGLLLWAFNPDIRYTSSKISSGVMRAMKVFYQVIENAQTMLDQHSVALEELYLPAPLFTAFGEALESSNALLPTSARSFQEWNVGILDRFKGNEV